MIILKDLSCGYGQKEILTGINLSISTGQITCLLGRNGAGKTTLFKTILGLIKPISGQIEINGHQLQSLPSMELARQISYVPQAHGNPFPFSVTEVVMMGQFAHSKNFWSSPSKMNIQVVEGCIQTLGISHLAHKLFSKLSGGEKQLVLIARAMAQRPQFIAMDEPTSNLDMGNQQRVMQLACLLREEGYGVIINTHSPDQAANYANQVVLLNNGRVEAAGHPTHVLHSDAISKLYLTDVELITTRTSCGKMRKVCVAV